MPDDGKETEREAANITLVTREELQRIAQQMTDDDEAEHAEAIVRERRSVLSDSLTAAAAAEWRAENHPPPVRAKPTSGAYPVDDEDVLWDGAAEAVKSVPDAKNPLEPTPHGEAIKPPGPPAKRFPLIKFNDIVMSTTAFYLVKGLIPSRGIVIIWGPPKCGKSFWTLDLMMHVALGWKYRGLRVKGGPVVYIALEGQEGFRRRVEAFRQKKLSESVTSDVPFHLMIAPLDLIKDHVALIAAIRAQLNPNVKPTAIAIDTLNRSLVGSESSDEDMAAYVRAAEALDAAFQCVVPIVHHCGHDENRPRGHSLLLGSLVAMIAIKGVDTAAEQIRNVTATLQSAKDSPSGMMIESRLVTVVIGTDSDGDPIKTCVIEAAGEISNVKGNAKHKLAKSSINALRILHEALADCGESPHASDRIPNGVKVVTRDRWRDYCARKGLCSSNEERSKNLAFQRAWEALQIAGLIGVWDQYVWTIRDENKAMGGTAEQGNAP